MTEFRLPDTSVFAIVVPPHHRWSGFLPARPVFQVFGIYETACAVLPVIREGAYNESSIGRAWRFFLNVAPISRRSRPRSWSPNAVASSLPYDRNCEQLGNFHGHKAVFHGRVSQAATDRQKTDGEQRS
jgi:hypothetical protein